MNTQTADTPGPTVKALQNWLATHEARVAMVGNPSGANLAERIKTVFVAAFALGVQEGRSGQSLPQQAERAGSGRNAEIIARVAAGEKQTALAAEYDLTPQAITHILHRSQAYQVLQRKVLSRVRQGRSQVAIAKELGISQSYISRITRNSGKRGPRTPAADVQQHGGDSHVDL